MTTDRRSRIAVVVSAITAVVLNIFLDATTSFPMLLRWVIAIVLGVALAAVVLRPRPGGRSTSGPDGPSSEAGG